LSGPVWFGWFWGWGLLVGGWGGIRLAFKVSWLETFYFMCRFVAKRRYRDFRGVLNVERIGGDLLWNSMAVRVIDGLMQDFDGV